MNMISFKELERLKNLNEELLETTIQILHEVDNYCTEHFIPIPRNDRLVRMVKNAINLIKEINGEIALPPNLQYLFEPIRRKVTEDKSDEEVTEPKLILNKYMRKKEREVAGDCGDVATRRRVQTPSHASGC